MKRQPAPQTVEEHRAAIVALRIEFPDPYSAGLEDRREGRNRLDRFYFADGQPIHCDLLEYKAGWRYADQELQTQPMLPF